MVTPHGPAWTKSTAYLMATAPITSTPSALRHTLIAPRRGRAHIRIPHDAPPIKVVTDAPAARRHPVLCQRLELRDVLRAAAAVVAVRPLDNNAGAVRIRGLGYTTARAGGTTRRQGVTATAAAPATATPTATVVAAAVAATVRRARTTGTAAGDAGARLRPRRHGVRGAARTLACRAACKHRHGGVIRRHYYIRDANV